MKNSAYVAIECSTNESVKKEMMLIEQKHRNFLYHQHWSSRCLLNNILKYFWTIFSSNLWILFSLEQFIETLLWVKGILTDVNLYFIFWQFIVVFKSCELHSFFCLQFLFVSNLNILRNMSYCGKKRTLGKGTMSNRKGIQTVFLA